MQMFTEGGTVCEGGEQFVVYREWLYGAEAEPLYLWQRADAAHELRQFVV